MSFPPSWRGACRAVLLALLWLAPSATAHIQWFVDVDVSSPPRDPRDVMVDPAFLTLALSACIVMAAVGALDRCPARLSARFGHALERVAPCVPALVAWGIAGCLVADLAYFGSAPVLLTPELKSSSGLTVPLQVLTALAAVMGWRRAAAAGLAGLFLLAASRFGWFRVLDYPLFLGLAYFLAATSSDPPGGPAPRGTPWPHAAAILRVTVSLTFLWGGVEKWLYPQWSVPLLCGSGRALLMGLSPDFFMQAAGFVEFSLAFAVLVGGVAGRAACAVLAAVVIAAVPMFGAIDAVGHAPFVLALAAVAVLPHPRRGHARPAGATAWSWVLGYAAALLVVPQAYVVMHEIAFGSPIDVNAALVVAACAALGTWAYGFSERARPARRRPVPHRPRRAARSPARPDRCGRRAPRPRRPHSG